MGKNKKQKIETSTHEKKDSKDVELDFSGITKFFKSDKKEKKIHEKIDSTDDKEIDLDFSKAKKIFTNPVLIIILLLIIPMFLAAFFRLYPLTLPIADNWAESSIQNSIKASIGEQVNKQYPNLPDAQKQTIIETQAAEYIKQNQAAYDQAIKQNGNALREQFKDDKGTWYLSDIDTWFWYRYVNNMVDYGHAYDEIKNDGKAYDNHMVAPNGVEMSTNFAGTGFHVWFGFLTYKIMHFFNSGISVMGSFFYVSVIISTLSIIPAFFLARKIGGNVGGFFAATIIAVSGVFLGRTAGGIVDTDAYNVFFPLLISWFFIEALENENLTKKIIWSVLTGVAVGLYSFAWGAWWYIFDFVFYSMIGYLIYYSIIHRKDILKLTFFKNKKIKDSLIVFGVILLISCIGVTFFNNFETFINSPIVPFRSLDIKQASYASLWPNVYTTVAELNEASVPQIIGQIGGKILFMISLIGIMFTMSTNKKRDAWLIGLSALWFLGILSYNESLGLFTFIILLSLPIIIGLLIPLIYSDDSIHAEYAIYLAGWFMATIFTSTKGVRFILLLVPVFGIAFGIAIGRIYSIFSEWLSSEMEINIKITKTITVIVLALLLIAPIKAANQIAMYEVPMMNDGWYQSLEKIKLESKPDAIINSWWDFGHWFKAISDRAVTFDGASQTTPMAHWIGKTLLTSDEAESIGILRMLDCGSNNAFDELHKSLNDTHKTVLILYDIVKMDKALAKEELLKYTDSNNADKVLAYTHCMPPEDYFITSEDMVGKSGVWAHFGSWDFERAEIWTNDKNLPFDQFVKKLVSDYGYDEKAAKDTYYQLQSITDERVANNWIAPWPSYMSGLVGCAESDAEIRCQNGLIVNKTNFDASIPTQQGILHPKTFAYTDKNGKFKTKSYEKGKVITAQDGTFIGAALIKRGDAYYSIMMDDRLTESLFTKLFYFDGAGAPNFEKFSDMRAVTGERIIVWKVNWN